MKEILTKLSAIQHELKAPKGQYNSFGGYYYRSCEDILEAAKPILSKQGCTMYISDEMVCIGDRNYIKATVTLTEIETGESVSNTAYAREELTKKGMDGSQLTGTASSYARKYALNGLFLIDDTKDSDTNEFTNQVNNSPQVAGQLICPECGNPIKGFKRPDGTEATPMEVYLKLGKCTKCHKKSKPAKPDTNAEPEIIP
jgi:hypothetical protein